MLWAIFIKSFDLKTRKLYTNFKYVINKKSIYLTLQYSKQYPPFQKEQKNFYLS